MNHDIFSAEVKKNTLLTAIWFIFYYKFGLAFLFGDLDKAEGRYEQIAIWEKGDINAHF